MSKKTSLASRQPKLTWIESAMPQCVECHEVMVIVPMYTRGIQLESGEWAPICEDCMDYGNTPHVVCESHPESSHLFSTGCVNPVEAAQRESGQ